jgi:hypothetical protein
MNLLNFFIKVLTIPYNLVLFLQNLIIIILSYLFIVNDFINLQSLQALFVARIIKHFH